MVVHVHPRPHLLKRRTRNAQRLQQASTGCTARELVMSKPHMFALYLPKYFSKFENSRCQKTLEQQVTSTQPLGGELLPLLLCGIEETCSMELEKRGDIPPTRKRCILCIKSWGKERICFQPKIFQKRYSVHTKGGGGGKFSLQGENAVTEFCPEQGTNLLWRQTFSGLGVRHPIA